MSGPRGHVRFWHTVARCPDHHRRAGATKQRDQKMQENASGAQPRPRAGDAVRAPLRHPRRDSDRREGDRHGCRRGKAPTEPRSPCWWLIASRSRQRSSPAPRLICSGKTGDADGFCSASSPLPPRAALRAARKERSLARYLDPRGYGARARHRRSVRTPDPPTQRAHPVPAVPGRTETAVSKR